MATDLRMSTTTFRRRCVVVYIRGIPTRTNLNSQISVFVQITNWGFEIIIIGVHLLLFSDAET